MRFGMRSRDVMVSSVGVSACPQADGSVAFGAAVSYLSHLYGKGFPSTVGVLAEVDVRGKLSGGLFEDATLHAARAAGISVIIMSVLQVSNQELVLELKR